MLEISGGLEGAGGTYGAPVCAADDDAEEEMLTLLSHSEGTGGFWLQIYFRESAGSRRCLHALRAGFVPGEGRHILSVQEWQSSVDAEADRLDKEYVSAVWLLWRCGL